MANNNFVQIALPKISIIIVTRERERKLKKCIVSLLFQTVLPDELVVINNDSSDGTEALVRTFQKIVSVPVRLINEKKVGYPFVYNRGLHTAKHEWVSYIDDDCLAEPDWIENQKKFIVTHKDAAVILGESRTINSDNIFSATSSNALSGNLHKYSARLVFQSIFLM